MPGAAATPTAPNGPRLTPGHRRNPWHPSPVSLVFHPPATRVAKETMRCATSWRRATPYGLESLEHPAKGGAAHQQAGHSCGSC